MFNILTCNKELLGECAAVKCCNLLLQAHNKDTVRRKKHSCDYMTKVFLNAFTYSV